MSLRQGRFKKHAISPELLPELAEQIYPQIQKAKSDYEEGLLSAAELCALYITEFTKKTRGKLWLSGKRKPQFSPLNADSPLKPFTEYTLRGIPEVVNQTLLDWHLGKYPLILLFRIPGPLQVLAEQKEGKRSVTMIASLEGLKKYVLEERDPLSFLIHDLQHAAKFYSHEESYLGQLGFYHFIEELAHSPKVQNLMKQDSQFKEEFEYAISDMNAYSVHLVRHMNSSFKEMNKRQNQTECLWMNYLQEKFPSEILKSLKTLYQDNVISDENTLKIQNFFLNHRS